MSDLNAKLDSFCYWSEQPLEKLAKAKAKSKKKLDPKAKVRNRGTVCVPAERAKDKKDHFPINSESQARNALARVHQYSTVPSWYKGSLKGLQKLVSSKVKAKYPKINVGGKDKKKTSSLNISMEKQAILKEKVDASLNLAFRHLDMISALAELTGRKLQELKSEYYSKFDPELEHQILEFIHNAKLAESSGTIRQFHQNLDKLLARGRSQDEATPSPIAAE